MGGKGDGVLQPEGRGIGGPPYALIVGDVLSGTAPIRGRQAAA